MEHELCAECDKKTGRAGIHDDSLYIGEIGPLCEECHDRLVCKTCGGSQEVGEFFDVETNAMGKELCPDCTGKEEGGK